MQAFPPDIHIARVNKLNDIIMDLKTLGEYNIKKKKMKKLLQQIKKSIIDNHFTNHSAQGRLIQQVIDIYMNIGENININTQMIHIIHQLWLILQPNNYDNYIHAEQHYIGGPDAESDDESVNSQGSEGLLYNPPNDFFPVGAGAGVGKFTRQKNKGKRRRHTRKH